MILLLLLLLLKIVASETPCPVVFIVMHNDVYSATPSSELAIVDYGIFFMKNGTQLPPPYYLPITTIQRITLVHHCAMIVSVVSDDPIGMELDIRYWIQYECKRLHHEPGECIRPKYSENTLKTIVTMNEVEATYSPTIRSTAPLKCEDRPDHTTCKLPSAECHWFGAVLGCHAVDYCQGLVTREGCLSRKNYCLWRNQHCISRSN
jgi:hypothetical protein